MKNLLNRFRNLIRRNAEVEEASSQKLPSLPEPLEENECDTFHQLDISIPIHEIVLGVPVSKKYYQDGSYRRNVINKDLDILNFTVFHFWLDGESWMDYRRIEHLTAVKFRNGEPVEAFDTDINTKRGNPDYAPKYPNAPLFEEIAGDFDRFVGDDTLVSYYLEDKCDTLFWEGSRVMKNKGRKIDLYEEATKILELDNYRFQTIMDHYGISFAEGTAGSVVASGYLFLQMVYDKLYK